ncbi:MAG: aminotransferase class I/II-fold pyridoxal phosphate-dependent enzyme [Mitsuokella sp.]
MGGASLERIDCHTQERAPILEALEEFKSRRIVPFDVPGHKRGRGNAELAGFLGDACLSVDVNSMKMLDNLCHPVSVIREAEALAAEAFGAAHAFFMVGGTTSSVQAMILTAAKRGETIILPRNVHRSVINAMILSGAVPVYVNPQTDERLGISLGMRLEDVERAILLHPDAKAVFVNNPTYYGICSNLRAIADLAHAHGMMLLADEAHGTHFYFHDDLPEAAMHAGADMASISMHKSGGSLTQSSMLLIGPNVHEGYVHQIINLTQTTSASYLLLVSLDISRRNLAIRGREMVGNVIRLVAYARDEINAIGDYYAYGRELIDGDAVCDFDVTKLSVYTRSVGLAGIEVYDLLRDEYDIQTEFGDIANLLAYVSVGDRPKDIERLVAALSEIRRNYRKDSSKMLRAEYIDPEVVAAPQEAFYAEKESLPIEETAGRVCSEFVMCYPPGIPILAPGERITDEILAYVRYAKKKGCQMTGPEDMSLRRLNVMK